MANMKQIKEISFKDRDAIFGRLERLASQANMSKEEYAQYRHDWKVYNDLFNCVDSAKEQGIEEGIKKGRAEGLKEGRAEGMKEGRAEGRAEGHAEGLKEGRAEGLKEGLEKGRAEEKIENAKKMKDKGSPLDFIADITGLTIEEINNL